MIYDIIPTLGELTISIIIWFLAFFGGFLLTENTHTAPWLKFDFLDMRPFNCRLCMSTHLTWLTFLITSYIGGWHYLYLGVMASAWTYYILKNRDN